MNRIDPSNTTSLSCLAERDDRIPSAVLTMLSEIKDRTSTSASTSSRDMLLWEAFGNPQLRLAV